MDLEGKHVVIIGGSSGMGLATAAGAAAAGAKVTIGSSDQSRLDAALAALPGGCNGVVVDVRSEASVAEALAGIGELDHLVYTAGDSVTPRPLGELPPDEARRLFDVRFWGCSRRGQARRPPDQGGRLGRADVRDGRGPAVRRRRPHGRRCRRDRGTDPGAGR
jgi:NAD(P)-dependent dehydrogenase (short-subunit alcohol dehydrogenase family)